MAGASDASARTAVVDGRTSKGASWRTELTCTKPRVLSSGLEGCRANVLYSYQITVLYRDTGLQTKQKRRTAGLRYVHASYLCPMSIVL